MILLPCGLVALAVIGFILLYLAIEVGGAFTGLLALLGGCASVAAAVIGLIGYCALIMDYIGAEHKASIMNREYGTKYTQEEVFYASDVIETVRELDRKRIEINGDILKK